MPAVKGYLGDKIYASWEDGKVTLTMETDPRYPPNAVIVLNPEIYIELVAYCKRQARAHKGATPHSGDAAKGSHRA